MPPTQPFWSNIFMKNEILLRLIIVVTYIFTICITPRAYTVYDFEIKDIAVGPLNDSDVTVRLILISVCTCTV